MDLKGTWEIHDTVVRGGNTMEISKEETFILPVKGGTVIVQISLLMRAYHWLISFFLLAFLCHITSLGVPHWLKDKFNLITEKENIFTAFFSRLNPQISYFVNSEVFNAIMIPNGISSPVWLMSAYTNLWPKFVINCIYNEQNSIENIREDKENL